MAAFNLIKTGIYMSLVDFEDNQDISIKFRSIVKHSILITKTVADDLLACS